MRLETDSFSKFKFSIFAGAVVLCFVIDCISLRGLSNAMSTSREAKIDTVSESNGYLFCILIRYEKKRN